MLLGIFPCFSVYSVAIKECTGNQYLIWFSILEYHLEGVLVCLVKQHVKYSRFRAYYHFVYCQTGSKAASWL